MRDQAGVQGAFLSMGQATSILAAVEGVGSDSLSPCLIISPVRHQL